MVQDNTAPGAWTSAPRLLPTPDAYQGNRGGAQHPDKRRAGGHSVTIQDVAENLQLLTTTTTTSDAAASGGSSPSDVTLTDAVVRTELGTVDNPRHLPAPRASRGAASTETMYALGAERDDEGDRQGNVTGDVSWGPYEPAIRRWEKVLGRPAPSPVRNDGRNGKPRLNPELTQWMMSWPEGHVTEPAIGLTREQQLKACGNGVVTLQARAAIRELLGRPGVPALREES